MENLRKKVNWNEKDYDPTRREKDKGKLEENQNGTKVKNKQINEMKISLRTSNPNLT